MPESDKQAIFLTPGITWALKGAGSWKNPGPDCSRKKSFVNFRLRRWLLFFS